ncbi:hypothetical protein N7478_000658 [Penicillium angulare]|uniref:uncharacterized protein n=1 Tax=Penicillium angulare TaxID=116970 RepID=UPI0025403DFB|nr:uncharacterized protein N7478_000658 [Penicillium angulare]KAJ5291407.1 hypothetical protein N7478_000658 [Penicillium angulare]
MAENIKSSLRDSAVIAIIDIFGITYFSIFTIQCLIFNFPTSTEEILHSIATLLFGASVVSWCFLSLAHRTMVVFKDARAQFLQKLEFGSILFFEFATSLSFIILQFPDHSTLQLGYTCTLVVVFAAHLVDLLVETADFARATNRFPYHCIALGLIGMVPVIQALTDPVQDTSPLVSEVIRLVAYNLVGVAQYFGRPLERIGLFSGWQPSLYSMHALLMFSAVHLSRQLLKATQ